MDMTFQEKNKWCSVLFSFPVLVNGECLLGGPSTPLTRWQLFSYLQGTVCKVPLNICWFAHSSAQPRDDKTAGAVGSPTCPNIGQFWGQDNSGRALHSCTFPGEEGANALHSCREKKFSGYREMTMRKINREHL